MYAYDPIAKAVEDALNSHPGLSGAMIDVSNDRGVVILSGIVENDDIGLEAVDIAAKQAGVVQVISNLRVEKTPREVDDPTFARDPIYGEHRR